MPVAAKESASEGVDGRQRKPARPNFAAWLFGYDIFISFALGPPPRGTQSLASDLARHLRERDHTVFFSEDEAPPGSPLDATLRRALHRSRVLVVLVNPETLRSPRWVRVEVEEFRRRHPTRPVIAVNIASALQNTVLALEAQAWLPIRDHIWVDAEATAAEAGLADDGLVTRLVTAPRRVRANVAWRWLVGGAMALLAFLTIGFGVTAWVAIGQRNEAVALQVISQGAGVPDGDLDTKLLAAAEALQRYPTRIDARLHALEQLTRAADYRALLRPGFDPGGWAASDDGRVLVVAGFAGEVALLSLEDWRTLDQEVTPMRQTMSNLPRLTLSRDGSALVTDRDGVWTLRSIADGRLRAETVLKPPRELASTTPRRLSPDHRQLLAAGPLGIWLWTIGEPTATRLADGAHSCLAFSVDGSRVMIGDAGSMLQFDLAQGARSTRVQTFDGRVRAGNTDCTRVLVIEEQRPAGPGASIRDALNGALLSALDVKAADTGLPAATFSRDGRFIAMAGSRVMGWWSVETGKPVWTSPVGIPVMGEPFVSPRGEWVAFEVGDPPISPRRLHVYEARTGRMVLDVAAGHPIDDVAFGLHGDSALTLGPGSGERRGKALPVWALGHRDRLQDGDTVVIADSIEFDGPRLVLRPKGDGGMEVRDPITGANRGPVEDNRDLLKAAAAGRLGPGGFGKLVLAPDGHSLGIGDGKGEVAVVDIRERQASPGRILHRHPSRAVSLAFDPESKWIASAANDPDGDVVMQRTDGKTPPIVVVDKVGRLKRLQFIAGERWLRVNDTVWDVEQRAPVVDLAPRDTRLAHVEVDPVGDPAAWLFDDGSLRLGKWSSSGMVAQACALVVRNLGCGEWRRLYGAEPYRRTCQALPGPQCARIDR